MMTLLYNVMMQVPSTPVLHPGLNNVYGRAKFKKDSGVTRFLGVFQETKDCAAACIGFLVAGQRCYSFTHHLQEMPPDWRGNGGGLPTMAPLPPHMGTSSGFNANAPVFNQSFGGNPYADGGQSYSQAEVSGTMGSQQRWMAQPAGLYRPS